MKKYVFILMSLMGLFAACDPVIDDKPIGGVISADDLNLEVTNLAEGSNAVVLKNNTPGVGSYWDYGTGVSIRQCDTIVMPYVGDITVNFIGLCDGGQVEAARTVHITKIDHAIEKEWTEFAGSSVSGKSWTWDIEGTGGAVYGTAGWLTQNAPAWDVKSLDELEDKDCHLVFDLNGGPNLSKVDANGKVLEKGTFNFDMSATKNNPDNGAQWSIGTLTISGVSVLSGHGFYDAGKSPITKFQILKLTDNKLVLCWNPDDADAWTDATFWMLKSE